MSTAEAGGEPRGARRPAPGAAPAAAPPPPSEAPPAAPTTTASNSSSSSASSPAGGEGEGRSSTTTTPPGPAAAPAPPPPGAAWGPAAARATAATPDGRNPQPPQLHPTKDGAGIHGIGGGEAEEDPLRGREEFLRQPQPKVHEGGYARGSRPTSAHSREHLGGGWGRSGSSSGGSGSKSRGGRSHGRAGPDPLAYNNILSFFYHTTPFVPCDAARPGAFRLRDLWACYDEWSAFGVEVPLQIGKREKVSQFYVPYLSGMQLYAKEEEEAATAVPGGEAEEEGVFGSPDSLGGGSDGELNYSSDASGASSSDGGSSRLSEDGSVLAPLRAQQPKHLLYEYMEHDSPYKRSPLSEKVAELAAVDGEGGAFPGLAELSSADLHPASWLSVAWYPLYRIPAGRAIKDLNACFLTFHNLSDRSTDAGCCQLPLLSGLSKKVQQETGPWDRPLWPFASASYKIHGKVWVDETINERQHCIMMDTANWWLQRRDVKHPDFQFFQRSWLW